MFSRLSAQSDAPAHFVRTLRTMSEVGPGGRSSVSGMKVALFGATGFLGRYVTNEFGRIGSTAYIANRGSEMEARHLRPMFDLGNYAFYYYDVRDEDSIRECMEGADVVVNMVGKRYQTKHLVPTNAEGKLDFTKGSRVNFSFADVNVTAAQTLARLAKEAGAEQFIHLSALTQNKDSSSEWCKTKALGEEAVRSEFKNATIIRPATMFGHEDWFLNWYAWMGERLFVPILNDGDQLVQPVHVTDVAKVVSLVAQGEDKYWRKDIELAGPAEYTRLELAEFVKDLTMQNASITPLPESILSKIAYGTESLFDPYLTTDDVKRWKEEDVLVEKEGVLNLKDFGIKPITIEHTAFDYLHRYRKGGHFTHAEGYH